MPGPPPKPDAIRRNKPDVTWTDLPKAGRTEPAPDLPTGHGLRAPGKRRWESIWSTPAATQWGEEEFPQALRLCQLDDIWQRDRDQKVLPELRHLEAALGLTAKARKELRWRIVDGDVIVEQAGLTDVGDRVRALRVVDPQAG